MALTDVSRWSLQAVKCNDLKWKVKVKVMTFQQENNKITETFYNHIIKPFPYAADSLIHLQYFWYTSTLIVTR